MERRGWTVLVGACLVAVMTWQVLSMKVAYVALGPGPTVDVLGEYEYQDDQGEVHTIELISSSEDSFTESEGQLRLVTVRIHDKLELSRALYYWLSDDYAVIPRVFQYPDDKSKEEIAQEQEQMWVNSQNAAETAALRVLGHPVSVEVTEVESESANPDFRSGDVIVDVDGEEVTSQEALGKLIAASYSAHGADPVDVVVDRDGEKVNIEVQLEEASDGTVIVPGIDIEAKQDDPYDLKITTEGLNIGGPSAGMIFALAMIDRVEPEDLTGGQVIAGTGEIDEDGHVGPIGGVAQKVVGAHEDGATIFLTPQENCESAKANAPDGLTLVKVHTLDDALAALKTLRDGGTPTTC